MKNVVTLDEIRDVELGSTAVFDQFLKLLELDIPFYFKRLGKKKHRHCPACSTLKFSAQFSKLGFDYQTCDNCGTMFVENLPEDDDISLYYENSKSYRLYVEEYLSSFEKEKTENLFLRRCDWILDSCVEYNCTNEHYLDLRTKYPHLFSKIQDSKFFKEVSTYCPIFNGSTNDLSPLNVFQGLKKLEDESISALSAFEYLEGIFQPEILIKNIHRILSDKGLFFLTTRCVSGFDIQILWEHSKSILPPQHVTLFSIEGMVCFLESNGFSIKELSTPGQLDLDVVSNEILNNPKIPIPYFIRYLIQRRDKATRKSFKEFLQKHRLSSHTRIVAQKI